MYEVESFLRSNFKHMLLYRRAYKCYEAVLSFVQRSFCSSSVAVLNIAVDHLVCIALFLSI
jgi:hypothetical protein